MNSSYFRQWFHCLDAAVIIAAFVIDVLLRGPFEEAGSLIIILRLWRIFKIIEEFGTGANDEMTGLYEHINLLRAENDKVRSESDSIKNEIDSLRKRVQVNGKVNGNL